MNYILHSVERIIADIGNHLQCFIRTNQNDLSKLYLKGNFDLKQQLLSLSTSPESPKIIKNKIQVHQIRVSILLNILKRKMCYCQSKCEMFEICKQDIIGPMIIDLCDFLKFIYEHFPHAFNLDLKAPEKVYKHYAEIITKSPIILKNKNSKNEYFNILTEPFVNFIKHKKKKYTYQHIKYLMNLLETIDEIPHESLSFDNMVDLCVIYNINSPRIYQYIIKKFKSVNEGHKTNQLKVKHFNHLKRWIETTDCICPTGYRPSKDSLKHMLSMWLKKEYNFFNYNIHIAEQETPVFDEMQLDYSFKIKTSFSVRQLVCFLKILIENKIFLTDTKPDTIKGYANMFASKNSDELSQKNFANKFSGKDVTSLKYVKNVLLELIRSIEFYIN